MSDDIQWVRVEAPNGGHQLHGCHGTLVDSRPGASLVHFPHLDAKEWLPTRYLTETTDPYKVMTAVSESTCMNPDCTRDFTDGVWFQFDGERVVHVACMIDMFKGLLKRVEILEGQHD